MSFTPPELRGRGHSQPKRVSQSGKKSPLSQAVAEPSTFWAVFCSHTIPSSSQLEFLVQISLCLFFPCLLHSCHYVCFPPLSPCCFSQSFQGFWWMVSQNLGWKRAPRALRSSKSSSMPRCLLLARSIAWSHSTKFFTWQRCFLLHWDQPKFSDPEHNTHLEGGLQILSQGCLVLKENQPFCASTVPLSHQSRFSLCFSYPLPSLEIQLHFSLPIIGTPKESHSKSVWAALWIPF